jgi:hypothetical protein
MTSLFPQSLWQIPAITLWEPWASWVASEYKTIETRLHTRLRSLVGRTIAIHAGLKFDDTAYAQATPYLPIQKFKLTTDNRGKVLCLVEVEGFRELAADDSPKALIDCGQVKRYGLVLGKVWRLPEPQPARGSQGIWTWQPTCEIPDLI